MRAYFFGNFYLSSIQQGIQAGHCLGRIIAKYAIKDGDFTNEHLNSANIVEFLTKHETFILLNGGDQKALAELHFFFEEAWHDEKNEFPFGFFKESEEALNSALTCVGILLPARIYEFADLIRNDKDGLLRFNMEEQFNRRGFATFNMEKIGDPDYTLNNRWEYEFAQLLNTYSLAR